MKALVTALVALLAFSSFSSMAEAQGRPFPGAIPHDGGPMIHPIRPDRPDLFSQDNERIYNALNVVQERIRTRDGYETMVKSVGGLECTERRVSGPRHLDARYSCELTSRPRLRNDARIYSALNVAAQRFQQQMYDRFGRPVTDRWGRPVYDRDNVNDVKQVGGLQCTETRPTRGYAQTSCTLR